MRAKGKDPDEIIRKRLGKSARPAAAPASGDTTTVVRQGKNRSTSAPQSDVAEAAAGDAVVASASDRQRVQRQQPSRQTRANRKQARPRQSDGQTKE